MYRGFVPSVIFMGQSVVTLERLAALQIAVYNDSDQCKLSAMRELKRLPALVAVIAGRSFYSQMGERESLAIGVGDLPLAGVRSGSKCKCVS